MKKNSKYVGVDDKFIPEDEKYVDDSLLGNKEETKKIIGKTVKVAGIGYLVYTVIFLILFVTVFIIIFRFMGNTSKQAEDTFNQAGNFLNQIGNQMENLINQSNNDDSEFEQKKIENEKASFNRSFEMYSGTQRKEIVIFMLNEVEKNNQKNSAQIIKVIYNDINATDSNNILEIKKKLNEDKEYEVLFNYDTNGYVNQVTIKDI